MGVSFDAILNFLIPFLLVSAALLFFYKVLKGPIHDLINWIKDKGKGKGPNFDSGVELYEPR